MIHSKLEQMSLFSKINYILLIKMGQICKLPSTPELNTDNNANHIKQMT